MFFSLTEMGGHEIYFEYFVLCEYFSIYIKTKFFSVCDLYGGKNRIELLIKPF